MNSTKLNEIVHIFVPLLFILSARFVFLSGGSAFEKLKLLWLRCKIFSPNIFIASFKLQGDLISLFFFIFPLLYWGPWFDFRKIQWNSRVSYFFYIYVKTGSKPVVSSLNSFFLVASFFKLMIDLLKRYVKQKAFEKMSNTLEASDHRKPHKQVKHKCSIFFLFYSIGSWKWKQEMSKQPNSLL